jgi:hypothetical protein
LQSCDDPANGFALGLRNVYLRERDADPLLARPVLAPVAVLAKGDVDRSTIDRIRKESGMTVESIAAFFSETEVGQEIGRRGAERTLVALLRSRFGDHPRLPAIAGRLARLTDQADAIEAITRAQSPDELL